MDERFETAWRDEQIAHHAACKEARAAVMRALRQPRHWAAQAAELLIWAMKLTTAALVAAVVMLVLLKSLTPESANVGGIALAVGYALVALMIPFVRKLWPSSPFRAIWLATYQTRRATNSRENA